MDGGWVGGEWVGGWWCNFTDLQPNRGWRWKGNPWFAYFCPRMVQVESCEKDIRPRKPGSPEARKPDGLDSCEPQIPLWMQLTFLGGLEPLVWGGRNSRWVLYVDLTRPGVKWKVGGGEDRIGEKRVCFFFALCCVFERWERKLLLCDEEERRENVNQFGSFFIPQDTPTSRDLVSHLVVC